MNEKRESGSASSKKEEQQGETVDANSVNNATPLESEMPAPSPPSRGETQRDEPSQLSNNEAIGKTVDANSVNNATPLESEMPAPSPPSRGETQRDEPSQLSNNEANSETSNETNSGTSSGNANEEAPKKESEGVVPLTAQSAPVDTGAIDVASIPKEFSATNVAPINDSLGNRDALGNNALNDSGSDYSDKITSTAVPTPGLYSPSGSVDYRGNEYRREDTGERRYRGYRSRNRVYYRHKVDKIRLHNLEIDYKRPDILRRFITARGKILPRRVTGNSAKNQRRLVQEIKRARILALLPMG